MSCQLLLFDFCGRISRKWFWIVTLALLALQSVWGAVVIHALEASSEETSSLVVVAPSGLLIAVHVVALVIMTLISMAVQVKRWHDRDKSGWWVLIHVVPVVGTLYALLENGCLKGTDGPNRYGPDPLVDPVAALDGV